MKLSKKVKKGDMIIVYVKRGKNWRVPVLSIEDSTMKIVVDARSLRNGYSTVEVDAKISESGNVYGVR